jgi:lysophospholipase L1-like esterase
MSKISHGLIIFVVMLIQGTESMAREKEVKIGLIGDSTVAVQSGWGPAFASRFNDKVKILNYAKNGATLQALTKKLDELVKLKPDYVLIQFGHNDQKRYDTDVYSTRLKSYIKRIQKAGGKPIIVSSVVRRSFKDGKIVSNMIKGPKYSYKANLTAYAKAAQTVAAELKLPFIDLHTISAEHHTKIGKPESMTYNFKEGDRTHFNKKGAQAIVDLILPELKRVAPELTVYLNPNENSPVSIRAGSNIPSVVNKPEEKAFKKASSGTWKKTFADSCSGEWKKNWFLDGEIGTVKTGPKGMTLTAGPTYKNDAHHMVLWTKESFAGDLKIEFDYTRLDREKRCVTILYIQATGSGKAPYAKDITKWNRLRKVPAMATYFNNMNTYHISYAAFPNSGEDRTSYIRGRRYMPHKTRLKGTDLDPDYYPKGLFATGVKHHITVIKKDRDLFMRVENPDVVYYCHMANPKLPVIKEGRIGLRHMFTRSATYKNIQVSTPSKKATK